jgi:hypothetical protein
MTRLLRLLTIISPTCIITPIKKEEDMLTVMVLKRAGILAILAVLAWMPVLNAATDGPSTQGTVDTLLTAIATNDYDAFIANAIPSLKTIITQETFRQASARLSPRLGKGYKLQYLGSFKNHGVETFLWKIIYKDGGDDMLAELELQNDRVAFFWFPPSPPPPGFTPGSPVPRHSGPPSPR